jgi:hypothetical protein
VLSQRLAWQVPHEEMIGRWERQVGIASWQAELVGLEKYWMDSVVSRLEQERGWNKQHMVRRREAGCQLLPIELLLYNLMQRYVYMNSQGTARLTLSRHHNITNLGTTPRWRFIYIWHHTSQTHNPKFGVGILSGKLAAGTKFSIQDSSRFPFELSACYYVRANLKKVTYKQIKRDIITKTH